MNDKQQAIRSALDAIPASPGNMAAETCIEMTLLAEDWHVVSGAELPVTRWNADKPDRCPVCHAVAIDTGRPRPWLVYECCRCSARFARWPGLARLLPFAGVQCSEHRKASDA